MILLGKNYDNLLISYYFKNFRVQKHLTAMKKTPSMDNDQPKQYASASELKKDIANKVGITEEQVGEVLHHSWDSMIEYAVKEAKKKHVSLAITPRELPS